LSNDRLTRSSDGRYRIALKRIWDDGTAAIVVSGEELLARLAVLVPPPRFHTTRYFGCFAPRSKLRRLVVPCSPAAPKAASDVGDDSGEHKHRYRLSWAQALAKVFEVDVTQCARCGHKGMQQIAVISDARVLRAMLASMQREAKPP